MQHRVVGTPADRPVLDMRQFHNGFAVSDDLHASGGSPGHETPHMDGPVRLRDQHRVIPADLHRDERGRGGREQGRGLLRDLVHRRFLRGGLLPTSREWAVGAATTQTPESTRAYMESAKLVPYLVLEVVQDLPFRVVRVGRWFWLYRGVSDEPAGLHVPDEGLHAFPLAGEPQTEGLAFERLRGNLHRTGLSDPLLPQHHSFFEVPHLYDTAA